MYAKRLESLTDNNWHSHFIETVIDNYKEDIYHSDNVDVMSPYCIKNRLMTIWTVEESETDSRETISVDIDM